MAAQTHDSSASGVRRLVLNADNKLYQRQHKASIDTSYIEIPEYRWTFKSQLNLNSNLFGISLLHQGEGAVAQLTSVPAVSQGISVSWRNLTVGAAINPAWFIKRMKNDDFCYTISLYGNKLGMAATIRGTSSLQGIVTALPDLIENGVYLFLILFLAGIVLHVILLRTTFDVHMIVVIPASPCVSLVLTTLFEVSPEIVEELLATTAVIA